MKLSDRIGIDLQAKFPVEEAITWAASHGVSYIDVETDIAPNAFERFDEALCERIRESCANYGIRIGLHTLSSVNTAEISPFVSRAVDDYLKGYIDLAERLGAGWIVVHGGYHFGDRDRRLAAAVERLARVTEYAESRQTRLLLENLQREPDGAEVNYLPHTVDECHYFFDRIDSPSLGWAFTINHATLEPESINGFLDALPVSRLGEVRVADNNGKYEVHMFPGEGIIDFADMFGRIEASGYSGHYMCNFGTSEEMLQGRSVLEAKAKAAGLD